MNCIRSVAVVAGPLLEFTKTATQCFNIVPSQGSCPRDRLVDFDYSIQSAVGIVSTGVTQECSDSGADRVKPLVYARLARGGKTTFLIYLFEALKEVRCAPILITFNGHFFRSPGESQLQALIRLLSVAMTDINPADSHNYSYRGKDDLLEHIKKTADGLPVVLLIDELNSLSYGRPLDADASYFLKRYFLDRRGYYLVFTSHILLDLDEVILNRSVLGGGAYMQSTCNPPSPRLFLTVHQPLSTDKQVLREMSEECEALTPAEIAIYGGIPSLIYVSKGRGKVTTPTQRFVSQKISVEAHNELSVLQKFIKEVLTGRRIHTDDDVRQFDMFSSIRDDGLAWWPLCYISCILDLFPSVIGNIPFNDLVHDHLRVQATRTESGLDWELIVQSGLLLHCIDAKVNGTGGPFDIVEWGVKPDVLCIALPAECVTLDGAQTAITARMGRLRRPTIAIVTFAYARFPDYDGLLAYRSVDGSSLRVIGFQCKLNRSYPKRDAPGGWMEKSFLLRGNAPLTADQKRGWEYCSKETIISKVLGHSLSPLYPAHWPQSGATDEFD